MPSAINRWAQLLRVEKEEKEIAPYINYMEKEALVYMPYGDAVRRSRWV